MPSSTLAADPAARETTDDPISTDGDFAEGRSHQDQLRNLHFENVSAGEDAQQVIVTTMQEGIFGRNLTVKAKGSQVLGQMADSSIQQLSKDRTDVILGAKERHEEPRVAGSFSRVYGTGHPLTNK